MSNVNVDPITYHTGFETTVTTPLSSYDLLAILPFLLAAMTVAAVRKFRRKRDDTG